MSGYRRFVAYVYEYRKGKKESNCGFVKVEVRDQRCTMEIHLHCPGMTPETECRVYGFVRKDGLMNGILLGNCDTGQDTVECLIETDSLNMGGSGMAMGRLGGMVMVTQAGGFFGTEWDDQPIRPQNFREMPVPGGTEKPREVPAPDGTEMSREMPVPGGMEKPREMPVSGGTEMSREMPVSGGTEISREMPVSGGTEISWEMPASGETEMLPEISMPSGMEMSPESSMPSEESKISERNMSLENPVNQEETISSEEPARPDELKSPKESVRSEESMRPEPSLKSAEETSEEPLIDNDTDNIQENPSEGIMQEAREDFARAPRQKPAPPLSFGEPFHPFTDDDCSQCWKIYPRDFAHFIRQEYALRNNRFLQYGYSGFGHLLLCRRCDGQYLLGVPGGYDQQERFMANMFGFPYFKESPLIEIPKRKGGYWYRMIQGPDKINEINS